MRRNIETYLEEWKSKKANKPLLLLGARQIGKTYVLKSFAEKNFDSFVYINFEEKPSFLSFFDKDLKPERIIQDIELELEKTINPEKDLIIFDEIQIAPKAITALKYFDEHDVHYNIACAGSLLGVMLEHTNLSFPVGKVEFKQMYHFTFDEFLMALGLDGLIDRIKACYYQSDVMPETLHEKLLNLYKDYLCIGGMPTAILEYIACNRNLARFDRSVLEHIVHAYIADMSKYVSASESIKVQAIFKSLHEQLARENKKFKYSTVKKGSKASHFNAAIEWLIASNVHLMCKSIHTAKLPISVYVKENSFKLFMNDTGLLNALSKMPFSILKNDEANLYKGAVTENFVATELKAKGYDIYYYKDNGMEIDFIIQVDDNIVPIEVKANRNNRSRSFNKYIEQYKPKLSIKISQGNFGKKNNVMSIPLYASFMI